MSGTTEREIDAILRQLDDITAWDGTSWVAYVGRDGQEVLGLREVASRAAKLLRTMAASGPGDADGGLNRARIVHGVRVMIAQLRQYLADEEPLDTLTLKCSWLSHFADEVDALLPAQRGRPTPEGT